MYNSRGSFRSNLLLAPVLLLFLAVAISVHASDGARTLPPAAKRKIDFAADIQPLLAQACFSCHGQDKQESKYRLDQKEIAFRGGELGEKPILPGQSDKSPLVRLVAGTDENLVMPPKGARLTAEQVGLIRAWIDQGAEWPEGTGGAIKLTTRHWSFQPLSSARPPLVSGTTISGPLDAFVVQKLSESGLAPSPVAERRVLIRRLYLDVLGIPPSPEEVSAFVADPDPLAYSKLVERVLASPRYGERWATHWLDVVRFAESNGFETNVERPNAWRYRDYVVSALNGDLPYDRFVIDQLAGDALGSDAATGFLVGGPTDQVKSPDPTLTAMQRSDELADVTNTTGTTFLGLTVGCARCHNHKFDPVLQQDYYSVQAVFAGVQHGERAIRTTVFAEDKARLARNQERIAAITQRLAQFRPTQRPAVNSRENTEDFPPLEARYVRFTSLQTNSGSQPCIDELEVFEAAPAGTTAKNVALASAGTKATSSGNYSGDPHHKLEHINDGRYGNSYSWISKTVGVNWVQLEFPRIQKVAKIIWGRDREQQYQDRTAIRYKIEVAVEPEHWRVIASSDDRAPYSSDQGDETYLATLPAANRQEAKALLAERKTLEAAIRSAAAGPMAYAGTFVQPSATHRLYRGDPMQPREQVRPDCLSVIGTLSLAADTPEQQRRVSLARWIASPTNPLTARVMVNRLWQHHFGAGIVDTPSDFGANGGKPSHPELLDWLARQLLESGWSLKHVHRLILLSSTYQQASAPTAKGLAVDAQSRLLWRYPPRRMDAEAIHDCILTVVGTLDLRMGGPGWSPFQPNTNYVRVYNPRDDFGPADWRRSVYMLKIRMRQDGVFGTFDCPDGGLPQPRRARSTTALQALSLLNSNFVLQQSGLLAERLARESGGDGAAQVRRAFDLTVGRAPDEAELAAATTFVKQQGLAALCRALLNTNEFLFIP